MQSRFSMQTFPMHRIAGARPDCIENGRAGAARRRAGRTRSTRPYDPGPLTVGDRDAHGEGRRTMSDGANGDTAPEPFDLLRPGRAITGVSAVLLPFADDGTVDLDSFEALVVRTVDAGLVPAVNMDTGYVNLLTPAERTAVLDRATAVLPAPAADRGDGGRSGAPEALRLVAGAFVDDLAGDGWDPDATGRAIDSVATAGAVPVVFPSHGLASLGPDEMVDAYRWIGERCDRFIAFELGEVFSPAGRI
ncbi:MAG: hypothetical protein JWM05_3356, partial [Acidimicrobiales bacterium]|nr:hypothetical protein [Acidimicrobiales bacterium]